MSGLTGRCGGGRSTAQQALAAAIVLVGMAAPAAPAAGQDALPAASTSGGPVRARDLFRRTLRGTVFVVADLPGNRHSAGSGWLCDARRKLVVTNDHVVAQATRIRVYFPEYRDRTLVAERQAYLKDGRAIEGDLIDSDPKCDLALVRLATIPRDAAALALARHSPAAGDTIHSIGNPAAIDALWVYTHGTVRAVHRFRETDGVFDARVVQTQSPVNSGDSGGPAVNDRGELAAVVSRGRRDARLLQQFIDVSEVRAYLETAVPLVDPKTAEHFNARGVRRHARGRFDEAIRDFTDALRLDPKFPEALNNRGWCFYEKGDFTTAIRDFDAAIEGGYRDFGAYRGRAYANQRAGRGARVVADLGEAIRRRPDDAGLYFDRGMAHALAGRYDEALDDFQRAIQLDATTAVYWYNRGMARREMGDLDAAAADFDKAAELDPKKYKGKQTRFFRKEVRVANASKEKIKVYAVYRAVDDKGKRTWVPADPKKDDPIEWTFEPGETAVLAYKNERIAADVIRLWAKGDKGVWMEWKDSDQQIAPPKGYFAEKIEIFTFTFNP